VLNDERRRALETAAYGQSASVEESIAARRELEGLPPRAAERSARSKRPGRAFFVVGLATMLVVGLAGGVLLDRTVWRSNEATGHAATAPSAGTSSDFSTGSARFGGAPASDATAKERLLAADALLAQPATSDDPYPGGGATNVTYVPSTTRLVATTPRGTRIWIARAAGASGGYCLLSLDPSTAAGAGFGLASCSLPKEFASTGVLLSANGYDVTWKAGRVTVDLGQ
jgi:hypothetical protein